jgi:predicted nucleic acid-binding protein
MNQMKSVFDTNILIDVLKGEPQANKEYSKYETVIISRITWMEVLVGANKDETDIRDFMESYFCVSEIDGSIAEVAVNLKRSFRLKLPDAIIWATAKVNQTILVTRNTKDFKVEWEGIYYPYEISR